MKIYLFYHSIISDWNHGNAHFLRGIVSSLLMAGHKVKVFEPHNGWSLENLMKDQGIKVIRDYLKNNPLHVPEFYNLDDLDPAEILSDADLVIVHEWNDPELIKKIGDYRAQNNHFTLFFHDTHHRSVTKPAEMKKYDLKDYDGILVFGEVIRNIYKKNGWGKRIYTWHEAADTNIFYPKYCADKEGDLVWIGNWGDNERTEELKELIIEPVRELGLKAVFYGVRYPEKARKLLAENDIEYRGWLPNHRVPDVFAKFRLTVHVPRRPYVENLPGIPTIRPFEAMATGIPLISTGWNDSEKLFTAGKDYLIAKDGKEMKKKMNTILHDIRIRKSLTENALQTIKNRHTCHHRVSELFRIMDDIKRQTTTPQFNMKQNIL